MLKRTIVLLVLTALLAGALAQDTPSGPTIDTRLSILETRVSRLESDLSRLSGVPTQLGRIEEKITALTEKADGNSGLLQQVGVGIIMSVFAGVLSYQFGKSKGGG